MPAPTSGRSDGSLVTMGWWGHAISPARNSKVRAHGSYVEVIERVSKELDRVVGEVQLGVIRQRARAIDLAQKAELHRWKKHGKDAARLAAAAMGAPGANTYGPNNRLNPTPATPGPLQPPAIVADAELLSRFIRLCDLMAVGAAGAVLANCCGCLLSCVPAAGAGADADAVDDVSSVSSGETFITQSVLVAHENSIVSAYLAQQLGPTKKCDVRDLFLELLPVPPADVELAHREISKHFCACAALFDAPRCEPFGTSIHVAVQVSGVGLSSL